MLHEILKAYDSTPHFSDLPSFPHHKHLPDEVVACRKPTVKMVLQEVVAQL
jgi:histidinol phosphatase-like enzyme